MSEDTDDTQAKTRHKKKLEKLREKEQVYDDRRDRGTTESRNRTIEDFDGTDASTFGIGETQGGSGKDTGYTTQGEDVYAGGRTQGMAGGEGTARGYGERIRSSDSESVNSVKGHDRTDKPLGTAKLTVELSEEEKAEKERERNRQKQQRFRDKQREASTSSEGYGYGYPGYAENTTTSEPKFALKSPFKLPSKQAPEPVKLLTKTEAEDSREALIDLFCKGTSILDDLLEIIVRGHEQVQIWEMDADEAALFVDAHLKRAQKEQEAARTARVLLRIYDKFFSIQYLWSRSKGTYTHVKDHGGLSFR